MCEKKKRKYATPVMQVYDLIFQPQLLQTSGELENYTLEEEQNWP